MWLCRADPDHRSVACRSHTSYHHTTSDRRIPAPDPIPARGGPRPPPTDAVPLTISPTTVTTDHPFFPHCEKIDSLFRKQVRKVGCETRRWGFTEGANLVINGKNPGIESATANWNYCSCVVFCWLWDAYAIKWNKRLVYLLAPWRD